MLAVRSILHPTDFSPCSKSATELACSLAKHFDARLTLLHVITESAIPPRPGVITLPPTEQHKTEMYERLCKIQSDHPNICIECQLEEGDPKTAILEVAERVQPDLIVMGTHGRTGLLHLATGSVAESVLRNAACPVVTMRGKMES